MGELLERNRWRSGFFLKKSGFSRKIVEKWVKMPAFLGEFGKFCGKVGRESAIVERKTQYVVWKMNENSVQNNYKKITKYGNL